jgi:hypothetical protein
MLLQILGHIKDNLETTGIYYPSGRRDIPDP